MLEFALAASYQTFDGNELYPSKEEKAARLGYGLVANHPFVDGNKRIGIYVMISFLEVNGINIEFTDEEIEKLAISIADGAYKYDDVIKFLRSKLWKLWYI